MNCSVCYEKYDESSGVIAYRLSCGDIICINCIKADYIDELYYCPECGFEHHGESIQSFSHIAVLDITDSNNQDGEINTNDIGSTSNDSYFSDSDNNYDSGTNSRPLSVTFSNGEGSSSKPRKPCSHPDCKNKALSTGLCLKHSKNVRKSIYEVEQIANEMMYNHDLRYYSIISTANDSSAGPSLQIDRSILSNKDNVSSMTRNPDTLLNKFKLQERIKLGEALDLILAAKAIMTREPNILKLEAPVIVVGDIHGQFFDLVNIFEEAKKNKSDKVNHNTYLFLGDYVDRGYYSCEVMLYLISLKIANPDQIYLLRGNHECASVSGHFGFKEECKMKYGVNIYYSFLLLFQTMPLAAVISTAFGDIYACHGGLSPNLKTLDDIEAIDRLIEPEANSGLMDILWSDPIADENIEQMSIEEYQEFIEIEWRPNPARGCSYTYGYKAVQDFLHKNSLVCLVRAHEVQEEGYRRHFEPVVIERKIRKVNRLLEKRKLGNVNNNNNPSEINNIPSIDEMSLDGSGSIGNAFSQTISSKNLIISSLKNKSLNYGDKNNTNSISLEHQPEDFPPVITIFSAPNYCDRYQNKGAILFIDAALDNFRVIQYDCVEHPKPDSVESQNTNLIQAILTTCPYMPTSFRNLVKLAVELGHDDGLVVEDHQHVHNKPLADTVESVVTMNERQSEAANISSNVNPADQMNISNAQTSIPFANSSSSSVSPHILTNDKNHNISDQKQNNDNHDAMLHDDHETHLNPADGHDSISDSSSINSRGLRPKPKRTESICISLVRHNPQDDDNTRLQKVANMIHQNNSNPRSQLDTNANNGFISISESIEETFAETDDDKPFTLNRSDMMSWGMKSSSNDSQDDASSQTLLLSNHDFQTPTRRKGSVTTLIVDNNNLNPNDDSNNNNANHKEEINNMIMNSISDELSPIHHNFKPKRKSNLYMQVLASDSINEIHPEKLSQFISTNFKNLYVEESKKEFKLALFKVSNDEKPAISVTDLKYRFEKKSSTESLSTNDENNNPASASKNATPKKVLAETDRCKAIEALQNKFGGSGRVKIPNKSTNLPHSRHSISTFPVRSNNNETVDDNLFRSRAKLFRSDPKSKNDSPPHPHEDENKDKIKQAGHKNDAIIDSSKDNDILYNTHFDPHRKRMSDSFLVTPTLHHLNSPNPVATSNNHDNNNNSHVHNDNNPENLNNNNPIKTMRVHFDAAVTSNNTHDNNHHDKVDAADSSSNNSHLLNSNSSDSQGSQREKILKKTKSDSSILVKPSIKDYNNKNIMNINNNEHSDTENDVSDFDYNSDNSMNNNNLSNHSNVISSIMTDEAQGHHNRIPKREGYDISSPITSLDLVVDVEVNSSHNNVIDSVLFSQSEIIGLRLMFSLFDRSGSYTIGYEDLVAYAEETGDLMGIRDASAALEILDIDGDGKIGLIDFIHFARRLKKIHQSSPMEF
eukprot:gene4916-6879_t